MTKLRLGKDSVRHQLQKQAKLEELQHSAHTVRCNIRDFKKQMNEATQPKQRTVLLKQIVRQEQLLTSILSQLKQAGHIEKRGRPKREVEQSYKGTRIKFTAYLLPEQLDYMKQLQASGQIENVSAFLNELVLAHQKKNG